MDRVILSHGDGGKHTNELIEEIFYKVFRTKTEYRGSDSALLHLSSKEICYTTDSFVLNPIFFRGGDIGKLSVCGTINDLVAGGSKPGFLSASFIIEEGFEVVKLKKIVESMAKVCRESKVEIVTGDTKVVERGSADGVFINTSGIGLKIKAYNQRKIEEGDEILITGNIGEHGMAVAVDRYNLEVEGDIKSDCAPLSPMLEVLGEDIKYIKSMKDPTRGGIASVLNEVSKKAKLGIELIEEQIPISKWVRALTEVLGLDPYYLACEGRMLLVVEKGMGDRVLEKIKNLELGKEGNKIGSFTKADCVYLKTFIGGKRILSMLEVPMLPRIC